MGAKVEVEEKYRKEKEEATGTIIDIAEIDETQKTSEAKANG